MKLQGEISKRKLEFKGILRKNRKVRRDRRSVIRKR